MVDKPRRAYIRHPSNIPITIASATRDVEDKHALNNISFGGLSCGSDTDVEPGTVVWLNIPLVKPPFKAKGKVVWCQWHADGYDLGVEFMDADDAFRARMVEQICHIEHYKHQVRVTEGRELSAEQVAREWISRYVADFSNPEPHESDGSADDA
jgi:hypothetical protein